MKIHSFGPSATDAQLSDCERKIGRRIPEPFRSWLKAHNGGEPEPCAFFWADEHGDRLLAQVRAFLGTTDAYDGIENIVGEVYAGRVPDDLFPIATEVGSNLILLGASGERAGRVYYWDHNWETEEGHPITHRNIHPLADSFEAFLGMLHDPERLTAK